MPKATCIWLLLQVLQVFIAFFFHSIKLCSEYTFSFIELIEYALTLLLALLLELEGMRSISKILKFNTA